MFRLPFAAVLLGTALSSVAPVVAETGIGLVQGQGPFILNRDSVVVQNTSLNETRDLILLRDRAQDNPMLRRTLQQLRDNAGMIAASEDPVTTFVDLSGLRTGDFVIGEPFRFDQAGSLATARARGELIGLILQADLDGDMQVSRSEIRQALEARVNPINGMADLFLLGDVDENNVLDLAEIKAVADQRTNRRQNNIGGANRAVQVAWLFDFDGDGTLSPAEVERAVASLSPSVVTTQPQP